MIEEGVLSAVKKIVDVYTSDDGERYFRINWKDTWEPESNLISCEDILERFWRERISNLEKATKPVNTSEAAVITCCDNGKYVKPDKKKTCSDKSTQNSATCKCSELGKQVNIHEKKQNVPVVPGAVSRCDFSAQVNNFNGHNQNLLGSATVKRYEFGTQVNTYHREQRNASVQAISRTVKKRDFSTQVNTYHREQRNASVQASSGTVKKRDFSTQVNTYHREQNNASVQVGYGIAVMPEVAVQVNRYHVKNEDRAVQCSLKTSECGTQFESTYQSKSSRYDKLKKDVSTHDCAIQNIATYQDQHTQFEDSFTEYDGSIVQKEVSVQFSPLTIHCGVQTWVYNHDQCTQCSENIFQREIACQFAPKTISCGVQKDVPLHLDKYCQYEEHIAPVGHGTSKAHHEISSSPRYDYSSNAGTEPYSECQRYLVKNERDKDVYNKCRVRDKATSVTPLLLGDIPASQHILVNDDVPKVPKVNEEQDLNFNTGVANEKIESKMREMIFVADLPLSLQNGSNDKNQPSEVSAAVPTTAGIAPDNITTESSPVAIILTTIGETSTSVTLSQNMLLESSNMCVPNISLPKASSSIALAKDLMLQSNIKGFEGSILHSHSPSLSQPIMIQHQNEYPIGQTTIISAPQIGTVPSFSQALIGQLANQYTNGQATIVNTPQIGSCSLPKIPITGVTSSVAMQLLDANITSSIGGELSYLNQSNLYPQTPPPSEHMNSSTVTSECSQPTDAVALMYHMYFKSPDNSINGGSHGEVKKKKRTVKNEDGDSVDGKHKRRSKKKKSPEEKSHSDIHCLPVYDIIPADVIKDEHSMGAAVNCAKNDDVEAGVAKFIDQTEIPSSDAKEINDDFISRYWK